MYFRNSFSFLLYCQACIEKKSNEKPNLPFPKRQILNSSKVKEFADDNFNFDGIGRKFLKRVENTVGIGAIARYEQLFLFPQ